MLGAAVWTLGVAVWMLGAVVWMLGAVVWMLGVMVRMLGAMVWMLGAMVVRRVLGNIILGNYHNSWWSHIEGMLHIPGPLRARGDVDEMTTLTPAHTF
eukprot:7558546-Pyramimonas_sp.AAC.1